MSRIFAVLMFVLLVALAGNARAASCGDAEPCGSAATTVDVERSGCCASSGCSCEATPERDGAPVSPVVPVQGGRISDCAMVAQVVVSLEEVLWMEPKAVVHAREGMRVLSPVRRTVLLCTFLI